MNVFRIHPALSRLIRWRTAARLKRMVQSVRSPRRIVLSILAMLLGIAWVGQAVAGIFLRETADPAQLQNWIPLSLAAYAIWNVLKVTFRKPVEAFEWTEAERELLIAAPLTRADLVRYRFATIACSAFFKSAIFTLVMIPDIAILPLAFVGMFAGLLMIDLIRTGLEIFIGMLAASELRRFRALVFSVSAVIVAGGVATAAATTDVSSNLATAASFGFLLAVLKGIAAQAETWYGMILVSPMRLVGSVVLTPELNAVIFGKLIIGWSAVVAGYCGMLRLSGFAEGRRLQNEAKNFTVAREAAETSVARGPAKIRNVLKPIRAWGAGPLAWRQLIGARHYRVSLLVALSVPLALSCLPAISGMSGTRMVMNVVGGLAFYSFVLLPTTFRFDFRRDVDRLTMLKTIPATPMKIVIGQLAAPVILTALFQLVTLLVSMLICPYSPALLLIAMAILIPFNVFIFGFENLVFLWYPHRVNQEGIHVFLRTILAFTAKGLLFTVALVASVAWLMFAIHFGKFVFPSSPQTGLALIFVSGMTLLLAIVSATTMKFLAHAFDRFDPSCDLAGLD